MNFFDILTLVVLLWAVVSGLRSGFVAQLLSLCGVVMGVILAAKFAPAVGQWLGVDARFATVAGFVVTAVVIMILATVVARLLGRILSTIGLRWLNLLLGVVLVLAGLMQGIRGWGKAFWLAGPGSVLAVLAILLCAGWNCTAYYPSVADLQSSLTIVNSSSSLFTLKTMTIVSFLIPFVLAYIAWAWRALDKQPITPDEV